MCANFKNDLFIDCFYSLLLLYLTIEIFTFIYGEKKLNIYTHFTHDHILKQNKKKHFLL